MSKSSALQARWTNAEGHDAAPTHSELRDYLLNLHSRHPGFTESCATKCRDGAGRTSYEWLADLVEPSRHRRVLDLACGSGFLLDLCSRRFPGLESLVGVDMSPEELDLARRRVPESVPLHQGLAQDLSFAEPGAFDAVLCHWALTLMDPIEPVLHEVNRVLAPGGVFGAIVDGDLAASPGYVQVNDLIFDHVRRYFPSYEARDLGDPRVRKPSTLRDLADSIFAPADVTVETAIFSLKGPAEAIAEEVIGFFYAAFVLSPPQRAEKASATSSLSGPARSAPFA